MAARRIPILVHLAGAALASALAAYWVLRLLAPAPPVVPSAAPAPVAREPDAGLAARLLGDVGSGPASSALNIQVNGVFAAGNDSSAVISVEARPPRAVLLGHNVVAGYRLVEVRPDGITLEHDGVRTNFAVPAPTVAKSTSPAPMFSREGDTLTAPSQEVASAARAGAEAPRAAAANAPQPAQMTQMQPAVVVAPTEEPSPAGRVGRRQSAPSPVAPAATPPGGAPAAGSSATGG